MLSKLKTSKSLPGLNRVKDNNGLMKNNHIMKTINMLVKTKQKKSKRQPTKHKTENKSLSYMNPTKSLE